VSDQDELSFAQPALPRFQARGPVMAIGGAEEKEDDPTILEHFVRLAGGRKARLVVIPSASSDPEDAGRGYTKAFQDIGVAEVQVVAPLSKEEARDERAIDPLRRATGIFMSGGDQTRLADRLLETPLADCIRECSQAGVIVGGTSAGAAFLASHMIAGGESDATPTSGMVSSAQGLGLLPNVIVDTHFNSRGRVPRLSILTAAHPEVIAMGLDENTAALIDQNMVMRVIGAGSVTILDGSSIRSDLDQRQKDEPVMLNGIEMHVVTTRYQFDLIARKFVPPLHSCFT
jgi:cyanophycinase